MHWYVEFTNLQNLFQIQQYNSNLVDVLASLDEKFRLEKLRCTHV